MIEANGKDPAQHGPELTYLVGITSTSRSRLNVLPEELRFPIGSPNKQLVALRVNVDRVLATAQDERGVCGDIALEALRSYVGLLDRLVPTD